MVLVGVILFFIWFWKDDEVREVVCFIVGVVGWVMEVGILEVVLVEEEDVGVEK